MNSCCKCEANMLSFMKCNFPKMKTRTRILINRRITRMKRTQPKFSQNEEVLLYESKHQDGDKIQPHHHHFHQVLYALEGEGSITLDDKEYTFAPDCAAVIAPYSEHAV